MADIEDLRERARKRAVENYAEMSAAELEAALDPGAVVAPDALEGAVEEEPAAVDESIDGDDGADDFAGMTTRMLRERVQNAGIPGASRMSKADLVATLEDRAARVAADAEPSNEGGETEPEAESEFDADDGTAPDAEDE